MVKISVVIVTYNSEEHIYKCIDSVLEYNDIGDMLEIIVVDNHSSNVDFMFKIIGEKYGSIVKLVKNQKNGGYGQGNNVGIKIALGSIILIMNPDVRLVQPIFQKTLSSFSDKTVAIVGMKQLFSINQAASSFFIPSICDSILISCLNRFFQKLDWFISSKMCFEGACFFIKKEIFEEVGLFDEKIFMYGEEMDVFFRVVAERKQIYNKDLHYLHLAGERKWTLNVMKRTYISRLYLSQKYGLKSNRLIINSWFWHYLRFFFNKKGYRNLALEWKMYLKTKSS